MPMVSMKEIAKQCNVSVATVSKALNGYPDISEETRQHILKTASEMGYLPNSSARTLKTKRSHNLGVLFVDEAMSGLTHDYFNHVLESFKKTAECPGFLRRPPPLVRTAAPCAVMRQARFSNIPLYLAIL